MPGMGNHHHAIVTTSGEAQQYFDQGVNLVFGFNHEEAVRSFQRAAELDPKASMPHWGIAWALGPNYNLDVDDDRAKQANTAIAQALTLSTGGSEIERAYIEAMAIRFPMTATPDRAALARKYPTPCAICHRRYPDDLDAATLYAESLMNLRAWKLWSLDGKPAERTEEIVAVLESVLARDPNHLGANHYYIHTVEASPTPGRALPSATRLDRLAPAAGHLTHMPAHIYARVGDQAAAARANEAGARADREYFKIAPADGFYGLAYFTHNLHFLTDSEMMRGRLASARRAADEVAEKMAPHTQMMPMVESLITMKTAVLLRFGRHEEILALPTPPPNHPVEIAWWHFARGVALARTGKADAAAQERMALAETSTKIPPDALFGGTGLESARSFSRSRRSCSMRGWRRRTGRRAMRSGCGRTPSRPPTSSRTTSRRSSSIQCANRWALPCSSVARPQTPSVCSAKISHGTREMPDPCLASMRASPNKARARMPSGSNVPSMRRGRTPTRR